MKVVCKRNDFGYYRMISVNKNYNLIEEWENFYCIRCNLGFEIWIDKNYFMSKKELRQIKLKTLNESSLPGS